LKLNGTDQHSVYADDVNVLRGSVHTVKENAEIFVVASKDIRLEVNADKTKYMIMSRDKNAGRSYSIQIYDSTCEKVEQYNYLGTTLTNHNCTDEEIKITLQLGNT
jgi:hypothetical protein